MAQLITVRLNKGDAPNWGFRLQGGKDFGTPLVIQKVNCGSPAERAGLVAGDSVIKINSTDVFNLRHKDAQDVIVRAGPSFEMSVQRGGSTWKPTVTPTGSFPKPTPTVNNVSPVTKTSLAAPKQNNIGAIGTGHNVSAKPFAAVNGTANGPKLVNKQFNSPIGLYSEDTIAETLSAQAEVLAPGVLGVNFKKNEKNYDATNSAVYRMLQEAEKEPREPEQEQETGSIVTSPQPVAVAGLRHVSAPETKPTPPTPQLPPGQNICADCERLIVGVFVRIKDKNLHVECFKCSTCGTSLKNVGYYNINNKLYCDIHAKLAARSNPPAPNLVPVTVPPGGKTPSGAISAALASHGPPPAGPLSPNTNSIATPFQNNHDSVDCSRSLKENETSENSERFVSELVIPIKENDTNHNNNKLTKTNLMSNSYAKYLKGAGSNLSGPRPFSSVSGPLSPPLNSQSSLPRSSPLSPPITNLNSPTPSAGRFSSVKPTSAPFKGRSVQSIVWPPPSQSEPELPTACPLYFPPPSHVHVEREKKLSENCESEVEQINMSRFYEPKLSLCSSEVTGIMKSASECVETISDTIDTQRLVENILKNRPKSPTPPPQPENVEEKTVNPKQLEEKVDSADRRESFDLKRPTQFSPNTLETSKPNSPKSKIDNPVPKGWESPMVVALTVASDIPIRDISIKCSNRPNSSDMFSQIPPKRSSSALASALAIAPTEPFTPIPSTLEPVPLPEETVPYMPPEHLFHIEPKEPKPEKPDSEFVSALKTAPERPFTPAGAPVRKKKQPEDELLKDLPKPQEKLSMLAALTTAPDRPYSPLVVESVCIKREEKKETKIEEKTEEHPPLHKPKKPNVLPQSFQQVAAHEEEPPLKFPPITQSTFEYKADYSQIKRELSSQIIEQSHMIEESEVIEKQESETRKIEKQEIKEEKIEKQEAKVIEKQAEDTIYMKPLPLASALHKPGALPQYQVNFSETVEASLKMLDKIESQAVSEVEAKKALIPAPTLELKHHLPPTKQVSSAQKDNKKPVITVEPGQMQQVSPQMSFQPVIEDRPRSTSFSPRPRPLTPSMINKPPPTIPYYQANLVAQHHRPVEVNLLDPKSPAISRSPSPCPEKMRSSSPFRPPSACSERAKSPAPGPPPNPLKSSQPLPTPEDTRREEAKKSLSNFIPQYRDKMEMIEKAQQSNQQFYSGTVQVQGNAQIETAQDFVVESQKSDLMQKQTLEKQVFDSNKVSQEGSMTTSIKEHADSKRFEQLNKADFESVEKSADGSVQVQRKKMVTEEYEHVHKEKTIEIEKSSEGAKKYPFQKVNAPVTEDKIVGLRVTNPQPLVSPFLANNKQDSKCCTVHCKQPCQDTCKSSQSCQSTCGFSQLSQGTCNVSQVSSQPTFQSTCSAPQQSFQKLETNHSASARQNVPSSSTQNVIRPNVSQPNAGTSGGRQAGAIGVAPKRGRGVLNPAAIGGARIPLCGQCHSYIRGPFITALGKIWCPEHFICATPSCRRQLHDLGFVEEKGQLYCEYCFEQYLAPPCSKCSAKIKGDCLKAIGKNFHPECFNCAYCGKLFGNSPFFLEDGLPYCEADWNELFTTKCFACGFPVEAGDRWVEALNNNYHSQCFNCTMCKKNLEGQSFFAKGGRPFCKNHAR